MPIIRFPTFDQLSPSLPQRWELTGSSFHTKIARPRETKPIGRCRASAVDGESTTTHTKEVQNWLDCWYTKSVLGYRSFLWFGIWDLQGVQFGWGSTLVDTLGMVWRILEHEKEILFVDTEWESVKTDRWLYLLPPWKATCRTPEHPFVRHAGYLSPSSAHQKPTYRYMFWVPFVVLHINAQDGEEEIHEEGSGFCSISPRPRTCTDI